MSSAAVRAIALTLTLAFLAATRSAAQTVAQTAACDTSHTSVVPPGVGTPIIRTITVHTNAASLLPIVGSRLAALRRTTESGVIARQVLVSPGQPFDSARVEETLRRLRNRGQYADVALTIAPCIGASAVDLTITTRDAWTLRPVARVVPPATVSLGGEDANFLGTGKTISASWDQNSRGSGGAAGFTDPFLAGTDVYVLGRISNVAGNHLVRAQVRHHELSTFDPWRFEAAFTRQTFSNLTTIEHPVGAMLGSVRIGRVVSATDSSVLVPYVGAELDSARDIELRRADSSPTDHYRKFVGMELGLLRRSTRFDTLGWLARGHGIVDVPMGFEYDVLVAPGYNLVQHVQAMRYDSWAGRVWLPGSGHLIAADAWTSGFLGDVRGNAITRGSVISYSEAAGGYWGARFLMEQLVDCDPDTRLLTLSTLAGDPTFAALPTAIRLANRATSASLERAAHLFSLGRGSMLDGGAFVAGSFRWDIPNSPQRTFGVGVVGARFRLLMANGIVSQTRIDISVPVAANGSVVHRPLLAVSFSPLYAIARTRDGSRRESGMP